MWSRYQEFLIEIIVLRKILTTANPFPNLITWKIIKAVFEIRNSVMGCIESSLADYVR